MKKGFAFHSLAVSHGGLLALVGACVLASCASGTTGKGGSFSNTSGGDDDDGGGGGTSTTGGGFGATGTGGGSIGGCNPCTDFSSTPVIDTNTDRKSTRLNSSHT